MNSRNSLQLEGLSRIVQYNEKYHCAMISGYITEENTPRKAQQQRHARLLANLRLYSFITVSLKGGWENDDGEIEKEHSFFVINRGRVRQEKEESHSLDKFTEIVVDLGKKYEQEAIVIIPRGALSGKSKAYFVFPKTSKKNHMGKARLGRITGGMYSRVKERSFKFGEETKNDVEILGIHYPVGGMFGVLRYRIISKKPLEEVSTHILKGTNLREWVLNRDKIL